MEKSPLEKLREHLAQDSQRETVYLEYAKISDLQPLVPVLAKFSNLHRLYLYGNKLESLPDDLSDLPLLDTIDLQHNPISDINALIPGLSSLKNLKHLIIPDNFRTRDVERLLAHLPQLTTFNNKDPSEVRTATGAGGDEQLFESRPQSNEAATTEEVVLTGDDINEVAVLFDAVKQLGTASDSDAILTRKFDEHVSAVTNTLDARLLAAEDPFVRKSEVFAAKHALYDICFNGAIERAASDPKLAEVLQQLRLVHSEIIGALAVIPSDMANYYSQRMNELQGEVDRAERETAQLLEAAELLERETAQYVEEKRQLTEDFERQKSELAEGMGWLRSENEKLQIRLKQIEKRAPQSAAATSAALQSPLHLTPANPRASPASETPRPQSARNVREISLLKLKDIIEDIYDSKTKFDQKCADARLPRETMEQHLYTYLNQKYGLKTLIVEWATSIITAVKKFHHEDNDVAVFGKILRNEIDEEFRFVQQQLKQTVAELLRVYLKGKYPLKRDDDIGAMLKKRMNSSVQEEEWVDIIKYMYNHEDSVQLIVKVKEVIRQRAQQALAARSDSDRRRDDGQTARNTIAYHDFLQVLLEFQLRGHEKFLMKFMKLFRQFDKDRNGILSEDELRQLILAIDPAKEPKEIIAMLEQADPHNNKQINFSECVSFLSAELVHMIGGERKE
eukprot:TRINITY_DN5930_c0_g1_i1.p1 TRINITY_DN5930_c0_g1~~TRINITY_DN5930_c0_g1_i1.p1  ORF type:complete len:679 (-),score=216.80 TRINITY_DN5930_c0_g1_i1:78-2114(-)